MNNLRNFLAQQGRKYPIIAVAAGSGQVTQYAVEAGADILLALNAGVYRNIGVGSLASFMPYANANEQTATLLEQHILPRAQNVPVVAGVLSIDPTRDVSSVLSRLKALGVSGVVNWPTIGFVDGRFREALESEGIGIESEIALMTAARSAGLSAFGFALDEHAVARFCESRVDALILDVGLTRSVDDIREKRDLLQHAITRLNHMLRIAKQADPSRPCLLFGGPITAVEDLEELLRHSYIDGFAGGSVFERLPVHSVVVSTIRQFKSLQNERSGKQLADGWGGMVGKSAAMHDLYGIIRRISPYNVNICIEGESGTGKELVATLIHRLSDRARHAFVAMNCGAIPDTLIESELFGHEKGAFTSADRRRLGKFELAHEGTLLLDEIADLSPRGQVALLRAIQQREITRIGGSQPIPVNVRILAASNRSLAKLVEEGQFRRDLYYRLNSLTVTVPPLRERKEDIPVLVDFFISRLKVQLNRKMISLAADFYDRLARHSWPGNIRELEQVVCRATLLEDGPVLEGKSFTPNDTANEKSHAPIGGQNTLLRRNLVRVALDNAAGNKSRAAASLKISRKTLYKWMERM